MAFSGAPTNYRVYQCPQRLTPFICHELRNVQKDETMLAIGYTWKISPMDFYQRFIVRWVAAWVARVVGNYEPLIF